MKINEHNTAAGNRATAQVLLLYYHLMREGGITHDQTVYLDRDHFDPFEFIDVQVLEAKGSSLEIDESLLRTGSFVAMLCDLDDMVTDCEDDFLTQELTMKILGALRANRSGLPEEAASVVKLFEKRKGNFDHQEFQRLKRQVFERLILSQVSQWFAGKNPTG